MDVLKNLMGWFIKFVRYVTINIMVGGLMDRLVFGFLERAVLGMLDGGGGSVEEQVGVGGGQGGLGGPRGGGDRRSYDEERGRGDGPV